MANDDRMNRCQCQDILQGYSSDKTRISRTADGTFFILTGPPLEESKGLVICLHGIGAFHLLFEEVAGELNKQGFTTLLFDQIGRGRSHPPADQRYDADAHLDQIQRLLGALYIPPEQVYQKLHVIGHSMGGALAALFVDVNRARIASLTLISPAGLMNGGMFTCMRPLCCIHPCVRAMMAKSRRERGGRDFYKQDPEHQAREKVLMERVQELWYMTPESFDALFEPMWQSVKEFPLFGNEEIVQRLGQPMHAASHIGGNLDQDGAPVAEHLPTLLFWGDKDEVVPMDPNYYRWIENLSSHSTGLANKVLVEEWLETVIVPDCAHNPLTEDSETVIPKILAFIERHALASNGNNQARARFIKRSAGSGAANYNHRHAQLQEVQIEVPQP